MLSYTTGDIIKRARELADLQNSDFITWEENMHLLDESYKKLYQEVINANDKFYLTTIQPSDLTVEGRADKEVRYSLPSDFYQLHSILIKNNCMPVLKKAMSESKASFRYDIINNSLVLYGGVENNEIVINYYPTPKTLTLKAPEVQVTVSDTILDCNGSKYLTYKEGVIKVVDITTGTERTYSTTLEVVKGYLGRKAAILCTEDSMEVLNLSTGATENADGGYPAKANGEVFVIDENTPSHNIYRENNLTTAWKEDVEWVDVTSRDAMTLYTFNPDDISEVYMINNGVLVRCKESAYEEVGTVTDGQIEWIGGRLFYVNEDVKSGAETIVEYKDFDSVIGFNKVDFNTGYGVSVTSLDDDAVHIHSCFNDTELNFPNNFYFNYLAYQLAIAYKSKQNADITLLEKQAADESYHFFNSLSRDTAENVRIQNVYANGGMF